ncbi:hypothetical protein ABEX41_08610 [Bacillus tropicus]|nr:MULTISPECIES: hypothetical protein [Bacillus]EEM21031.1 hypothetical protein bthur0001_38090 [Bacillus thuringiensis serovar tochigiensis BGSC 4Y1]
MKNINLVTRIEIKGLERFKELVEALNNLEFEIVVHEVKQEGDE